MRQVLRQLLLGDRRTAQPELHRNVVEPSWPKAAIEMSQAGNDDPHNRRSDVRSRLVEHEEIEIRLPRDLDAGIDLLAGIVERSEF